MTSFLKTVLSISPSGMRRLLAGVISCGLSFTTQAAAITVQVVDSSGQPLSDGVVYIESIHKQVLPKPTRSAFIEQKARKFTPLVTVVQTNTEIAFPNNDTVRHHVYSFSTPKVFELKLYSGTPGNSILFDKPGTVIVGCNIHDQMVAYIHIVDTPYFALTDKTGKAVVNGVSAGQYNLKFWHYKTANAPAYEQPLTVAATDMAANIKFAPKPIVVK
jgi:plastocyanin